MRGRFKGGFQMIDVREIELRELDTGHCVLYNVQDLKPSSTPMPIHSMQEIDSSVSFENRRITVTISKARDFKEPLVERAKLITKYNADLSLIKTVAPNVTLEQLLKFIDILLEKED